MMKQEVITGDKSFGEVKNILSSRSINSIFVVTGNHFVNQISDSATNSVLAGLKKTLYVKKGVNVTLEEINAAYTIYDNDAAQAVLAIGGGSVMDLAKALIYRDDQNQRSRKPLFIAVPTTAGSGSEATCIAVVYENKRKQSLESNHLLPDIAILDPRLSGSLSPRQTAISGIDAFAQGIESFWSVHATEKSRSFAREAIAILKENLPAAVHAPTLQIREKVLWASYLAGKAINMTRTTGPHALSYFLSAHYNIPHGQAVALFLPIFFLYNSMISESNCNHHNGPEAILQSLQELNSILQVSGSEEAMEFTRQFLTKLGLANNFEDLGIEKSAILENLLEDVNQQRFKNNPALFNKGALLHLCNKYL